MIFILVIALLVFVCLHLGFRMCRTCKSYVSMNYWELGLIVNILGWIVDVFFLVSTSWTVTHGKYKLHLIILKEHNCF